MRLSGWKAIALFMGVSIDTARRYAKDHGLPITRTKTGRPVSYPSWIEQWDREGEGAKRGSGSRRSD